MNISLKLKHTEMLSLVAELERVMPYEAKREAKPAIIAILMVKFYKKLKEKCAVLEPREYRFGIPPEIGLAFIEVFKKYPIDASSHAGNIISRLIAHFDKQITNLLSIW